MGFVVYTLSLAFAVSASAAAAIVADVFGLDAGLDDPGFSGSGGGARSGSELSHLYFVRLGISLVITFDMALLPKILRTMHDHKHAQKSTQKRGIHRHGRTTGLRERRMMLEHKLSIARTFSVH